LAATHQNLYEKIHTGEFRTDLYYRLNVVAIQPPALIDRMDDFEDLLYTFAKQMRVRFSHAAIQKLKKHKWPGNIRELKNTVARASAFFPKQQIEETDVEEILDRAGMPPSMVGGIQMPSPTAELPVIKEIERQMIIKRLVANRGNQRRTAQDLGMPKSTLHDRLKLYQIDPRAYTPEGQPDDETETSVR
jgi:DNA-binding NtrC family response regulator